MASFAPRNNTIDMIKGTGVALIVLGHSGFPWSHFVYLFHVAIFFIASGYLFNDYYSESFSGYKTLLRKRLCSLYLPCLGWNLAFLLSHNCFYELNLVGEPLPGSGRLPAGSLEAWFPPLFSTEFWRVVANTATRFASGMQLVSVSWFFRSMLAAVLAFAAIDYVIRKIVPRWRLAVDSAVCLALLMVGFLYSSGLGGFGPALSSMIFLPVGMLLRRHPLPASRPWPFAAAGVGLACLLLLSPLGFVELSANTYTNPLFLLTSSVAGWFFLWGLMTLFSRYRLASSGISYLGVHSIPVLFLHFLCFKAATLVMICLKGGSWELLARYPYGEASWWPLSFAAGIVLPLLLVKIGSCLKTLARRPWQLFTASARRSVS